MTIAEGRNTRKAVGELLEFQQTASPAMVFADTPGVLGAAVQSNPKNSRAQKQRAQVQKASPRRRNSPKT